MGWQEDLARANDPYLMTPSAVRKSAAASNIASLARRGSGKDWQNKGDPDYNKRWDVKLGNQIRKEGKKFGSTVGDITTDLFIDPAKKGISKFLDHMPSIMTMKTVSRHAEEVDEAERDYDVPFYKGGNPIAVDKATPAYKFLLDQMEEKNKDAFREAVGKDKVFWSDLEEMSGDKYDASHPGLIALLNDPSRLNDMDPIRGLNYMRSITGKPSNWGFDEFEAWRQAKGRTEKERGLTATQIAQRLLPQYRAEAADMYGEGFIGDTAAANYGGDRLRKTADVTRLRSPEADEIFDQTISPLYGGRSPADELYASTFTMDPFVEGSSPVSRQYKDMWLANLIDEDEDIYAGYS